MILGAFKSVCQGWVAISVISDNEISGYKYVPHNNALPRKTLDTTGQHHFKEKVMFIGCFHL